MEGSQAVSPPGVAPPPLLLIDTATEAFSVAVAVGGQVVAAYAAAEPRAHAREVATGARQALAQAGVAPAQLGAVAVGLGPGSYTGLRIGLAAAKGLCAALGCPLLPCSTLQGLAQAALELPQPLSALASPALQLRPMLDARRGAAYTATYGRGPQGLVPLEAARLLPLTAAVVAAWPRPWAAVGPGAALLAPLLPLPADGVWLLPQVASHARALLPQALALWAAGQGLAPGPALDALEPLYLAPVHVGGPGAFVPQAPDPRLPHH